MGYRPLTRPAILCSFLSLSWWSPSPLCCRLFRCLWSTFCRKLSSLRLLLSWRLLLLSCHVCCLRLRLLLLLLCWLFRSLCCRPWRSWLRCLCLLRTWILRLILRWLLCCIRGFLLGLLLRPRALLGSFRRWSLLSRINLLTRSLSRSRFRRRISEAACLSKVHIGAVDGSAGIAGDVHSIGKACSSSDDGSKCPEGGSHLLYVVGEWFCACLTTICKVWFDF